MKVVKTSVIDGKKARLLLLSDNETLKVALGNQMIGVIDGLWKDIQGEDWAQSGILKIEAEGYIRKKNAKTELEAIAEEFFRACLRVHPRDLYRPQT